MNQKRTIIAITIVVIFVLGYLDNKYQFTASWDDNASNGGDYPPGYGPGPGNNPYNQPGNPQYTNPAYNNPTYPGQPGAGNSGGCPPGTTPTQSAPNTIVCIQAGVAPGYGPSNNPGYQPPPNTGYGPGVPQPGYPPQSGTGWEQGPNNGGDVWIDNPRNADAVTEAGDREVPATGDGTAQ